MSDQSGNPPGGHVRRVRYRGSHPRRFAEKYKEHDPERFAAEAEKVKARGQTPAGTHRSIMVGEVVAALRPGPGQTGLDATLGYGGHSAALLRAVQPGGRLFAVDVDPLELPRSEARLRALGFPDESLIVKRQNFAGAAKLLPLAGGGFDFVLADLGVSSMQIDDPARGFTYKADGPLDLRLNPQRGQSAAELLAKLDEPALAALLRANADEPYAAPIARALCARRGRIAGTAQLAAAVVAVLDGIVLPEREKTVQKTLARCFQALRIAVNDEFGALDAFLRNLPACLKPGGRVAVLSFHSGEEKRVAAAFAAGLAAGDYADIAAEAVRATARERYDNPRSKPARLRWAVRAGG